MREVESFVDGEFDHILEIAVRVDLVIVGDGGKEKDHGRSSVAFVDRVVSVSTVTVAPMMANAVAVEREAISRASYAAEEWES